MQIQFMTNKENFMKFIECINEKLGNVCYYIYGRKKGPVKEYDFSTLETDNYRGMMYAITEDSPFFSELNYNWETDWMHDVKLLFKYGVEISFGFSEKDITKFDFSHWVWPMEFGKMDFIHVVYMRMDIIQIVVIIEMIYIKK